MFIFKELLIFAAMLFDIPKQHSEYVITAFNITTSSSLQTEFCMHVVYREFRDPNPKFQI